MHWKKSLTLVEVHAEGEVGRVVIGGVLDLPGTTMLDKMNYLNHVDDSLRRFLVFEPRGSAQMSTNLVFESTNPAADAGFVILQADKAHAMSGSNCICVITALLETGTIKMTEPKTVVTLETPAGLIQGTATCNNGKCEKVSLKMTPSFVHELDVTLDVKGLGKVTLDIAFGGIFYALVNSQQFNVNIAPQNARKLVEIGTKIHREVNKSLHIVHPQLPDINGISYTMFTGYTPNGDLKGATIMAPGRIDRSPCGTGNSARIATMFERGEIGIGDLANAYSIIDSKFQIKILQQKLINTKPTVVTEVSGRGWVYGLHHIGIDPSDPYPHGYKVSDCWGEAFDLLN